MEALAGFWIVIIIFAIGSFLALPWIWYHTGHTSRKLSRIIELLEEGEKRAYKTGYDLSDDSIFKGLSKEDAIKKWRDNPADNREREEIVAIWEVVNRNVFKYYSKDVNGIDKDGVLEALDKEDAIKKLQEQGLIIVSLERLTGK